MKWEFMNNWDEWHAFVIGWCEVICPWHSRFPMPIDYHNPMIEEFHYYLVGRAFGVATWVGIIYLIKLLWR